MIFSRSVLPAEGWSEYSKQQTTRATRVAGPFEVETREGTLRCDDGWLALDSNGDPYPIAADVFAQTYRLASDEGEQ